MADAYSTIPLPPLGNKLKEKKWREVTKRRKSYSKYPERKLAQSSTREVGRGWKHPPGSKGRAAEQRGMCKPVQPDLQLPQQTPKHGASTSSSHTHSLLSQTTPSALPDIPLFVIFTLWKIPFFSVVVYKDSSQSVMKPVCKALFAFKTLMKYWCFGPVHNNLWGQQLKATWIAISIANNNRRATVRYIYIYIIFSRL